jgi:acyl-CoA synthetase (AMP-forming)/AMP-acid ligase II
LSKIVAVVAPSEEFDDDRIRQDLGRIVPAYMIPSVFHREDLLPKNANGKIDRRLLSAKYVQSKSDE